MGSMNTSKSESPLDTALENVDQKFRSKLIEQYLSVKRSLLEGRDEAVGMSAGKFCEVVLRFLQHEVHGTFTPFGQSINNFANECRKLIDAQGGTAPEAIRVVMPRALVFIYTIRNKRGIGHVGGDVDANRIDAMTIARSCDWVTCELIRVFHGLSLEEAQEIVDGLSIRTMPEVWEVAGKKRVLRNDLSAKQKVLLLSHQSTDGAILVEDLCDWIEYSNIGVFKSKVLAPMHKERLIEYDMDALTVTISPLGVKLVEETILKLQKI
jgi:hypothetical protein